MSKSFLNRCTALLLMAVLLILSFVPAVKAEPSRLGRTPIGREDHVFVEMPGFIRPAEPTIQGTIGILVELNSGTILYAKNMHQQNYPASTTKVMTALLALENLQLNDTLTLSYNSTHDLISGGFDGRFREGQTFSVEEALFGLCLDSVNTLGYALAEKMDGSVAEFAKRMNKRAEELGAVNTAFTNPHGLNDPNHLTTAYDMAKILWGAIEIDDYRRIAGTDRFSNSNYGINFSHTIRFLHPENSWYDSRVVCAKSGWTEDAHFCRAVYATNGELDLICVVFHSNSADDVDSDVEALLDYGFNNFTLKKAPSFGSDSVLGGRIQDENGTESTVEFLIGEGRVITGSAILIPKTYETMPWSLDLRLVNGQLRGYASLGGVSLVEYPLSLKAPEETTKADYFPTVIPTEEPTTEEKTAAVTTPAATTNPASESAAEDLTNEPVPSGKGIERSTEEEQPAKWGGNILMLALIVCGAFIVLCLVALIFTLSQNRRLRKRMNRRNALKKDQ